jgi:hypothetical protein
VTYGIMTCNCGASSVWEARCRACACEARDEVRDDGRREMLWLMAVGLEMTCYFAGCAEHSMSEIWHGWLRNKALRALADLGDTTAQDLLRGG